jgi:hypothetical protein
LVVEEAAAAAFFFLWWDFLAFVVGLAASVAGAAAAGASADVGAAAFDTSAAIAPAARPRANKPEVIRDPDLFMMSPTVILTSAVVLRAFRRIRWIRENQPR